MNELDILDRLSIHRTMSQYLTIDQLMFALNCDRTAAKAEIERLRTELSELRKQQAEAVANSATVCNVFEAFGEHYDDSLSPADNVRRLIQQQAASLTTPTLNASCVPDLSLVESFKAQLIESVIPIFWPHIEAASDVIIERMKASAPEAQQAASVPDGWKLVPVEPTEHMLNVGKQAADSYYVNPAKIESRERKVYRHMLAAAPSPVGLDNPEAPKS